MIMSDEQQVHETVNSQSEAPAEGNINDTNNDTTAGQQEETTTGQGVIEMMAAAGRGDIEAVGELLKKSVCSGTSDISLHFQYAST